MNNKDLEASTLERVSKEEYSNEVLKLLSESDDNKTADYYMYLGLAFANQGLYREAVDAYSKGLAIDPFKGILYRHRGHRFLSCYRFLDGLADFNMAVRLIPDNWDSWYHLGLSYFLVKDYKNAAKAYQQCLDLSTSDDEKIAVSDWYYMTSMRLGNKEKAQEILDGISDNMEYGDNLDYYQRLKMYKGQIQPEELLPEDLSNETALSVVTRGFGLANYYKIIGEAEKAENILDFVIEKGKDDMYMAFGYMAALADKGMIQNY